MTSEATVLVIDDNPDFRRLLADYLSEAGFRVKTAADGEQGLRVIDDEEVDLAIVDLMMPNVNGYQVAGQLRERPPERSVPFVLISAYDLGRWSAEQLGAVAGYGKPLDFAALTDTVREIVDARGGPHRN